MNVGIIFKKNFEHPRRLIILAATALALLAFLGGYLFQGIYPDPLSGYDSVSVLRQSDFGMSPYKYINPLLSCEAAQKKGGESYSVLKNKLEDYISSRETSGDVKVASVDFSTMDGLEFGINTSEKYAPASMMKVPTMIAALKMAETQPEFLDKKVKYEGTENLSANAFYKPAQVLNPGSSYSISELLFRMIAYSDNNTLPVLFENMDVLQIAQIYSELGFPPLPPNPIDALGNIITVKTYSNVFRYLYNSTYLNREMSEKALEFLSMPDFPSGIQAGLPKNIPLAQKFGERTFPAGDKELHDCGIVYYSDHPYILCVMTKGNDFSRMAETISGVSKIVYNEMSSEFGSR